MFSFEMLLYACVILFNFSIFLNVCIYSIYRVLYIVFIVLVTFSYLSLIKSLWIKASAKLLKSKKKQMLIKH